MPEPFPWGRKSHFSIGGIEVVAETGLEVAYDDSPEVVAGGYSKPRRKFSFPKWEVKKISWKRTPGFWMGMVVALFGFGIGAGVVFALVAGVKAREGHAASSAQSSAQSSSASPSSFSVVGTVPSIPPASTLSSVLAPASTASTAAPSTFLISIVSSSQLPESTTASVVTPVVVQSSVLSFSTVKISTSQTSVSTTNSSFSKSKTTSTTSSAPAASVSVSTSSNFQNGQSSSSSSSSSSTTNFQTFKGALGGAHAIAITSTGNSKIPFKVQGTSFPDLPSAASKSCILQRETCEGISNDGSGSVTVDECLTQFSQCLAATPGATG